MAKKIVRGITDVKTINNQDFDTNNVNDLLSDGQYNYIHRKKGKSEEYHNLTDNIKTISSDNTDLLTVTNNNKTTNTALLSPKHDAQKEQVLESTRHTVNIQHGTNGTAEKTTVDTNPQKVLEHVNLISDSEYITIDHKTGTNTTHIKTAALKQELNNLHETKQDVLTAGSGITIEGQTISASGGAHDSQKEQVIESTRNTVTIHHGTNGTAEKTTVDTNPQKVLEHEKLKTGDGLTTSFNTDETTIMFKATKKEPGTSIKNLGEGIVWGSGFSDEAPQGNHENSASYITIQTDADTKVQLYIRESVVDYDKIILFYRFIKNGEASGWKQMVGDSGELNNQLARKEQVLESTRKTIAINRGEKTTVDTNPQKVLEHENLLTIDGISKVTEGNVTTIGLKTIDNYSGDLNELTDTCLVRPTDDALNLPSFGEGILTVVKIGDTVSQKYHARSNEVFTRVGTYVQAQWVWTPWNKIDGTPAPM